MSGKEQKEENEGKQKEKNDKKEKQNEKEKENEEKELNKAYEKKLEELKMKCCKELKILDNKLDKSQKNKKGYYELFIIENDINIKLELIENNIKNDEEKAHHDKLKSEFIELKKELAHIRGEEFE